MPADPRLPITPTVGTAIFYRDQVLLVKHIGEGGPSIGVWGLPAGKIEAGETAVQAACREVLEETGLFVHPDELVPLPTLYGSLIQRQDGTQLNCSFQVFATTYFSGSPIITPEAEPAWIDINKVKDLWALADLNEIVQECRSLVEI